MIELLLLAINFIALNSTTPDQVEKLKITTRAEFIMDGRLKEMEDSFCIYRWKEARMFEFNYHETLEDLDTILKDEVKYKYFGYHPDTNIGYIFSSLNDSGYSRRCNADSVLKEFADKSVDYFTIINNGKLIRKVDDPSKSQRTYVYVPIQKPNGSYCDTIYLIFSDNLKKVNYSFSKSADSASNSKLVGAKFLFNEILSGTLTSPKREMVIRLEQIKATNSKEIRDFMTRNKKYFEH